MIKHLFPLIALLALLVPLAPGMAQEGTPDVINLALADLSTRLGSEVTLANLAAWTWAEEYYADTSLGCPAPAGAYTQVRTRAYQFTLTTYDNTTYDYRVAADGSIVVLCVAGQPVAPTPGPTPVGTPGTAVVCNPVAGSGYLPTRFAVGVEGTTAAASVPSNARAEPLLTSEVVFQVPGGGRFVVVAGPTCSSDLVWWQVQYNNRTGWVAEGEGDEYWLQPLSPTPVPTATLVTAATPITSPITAAGAFITVENIGRLALRNSANYNSTVTAMVYLDEMTVAAGYEDGAVRLVAAGDAAVEQFSGDGHTAPVRALAAIQPDAQALGLIEAYPALASGDEDGVVIVWDPVARTQVAKVQAHAGAVTALAFSLDGVLLASASADGSVKLWNAATGAELAAITDFTGAVVHLTFNQAGTLLATATADGTVWVWGLQGQ